MYRVTLTDEQRRELQRRTRQEDIKPFDRDRLEMVRLAAAGWSIPRVARHYGRHAQTVRRWVKAFLDGGFAGLAGRRRGGRRSALTPTILAHLRAELAQGHRTWTARQIAAWLAQEHRVLLSLDHLSTLLKRAGLSYKRTRRTLNHKQDAEQVAAKAAELRALEKGGKPAS